MDRREAILAREESRKIKHMLEEDTYWEYMIRTGWGPYGLKPKKTVRILTITGGFAAPSWTSKRKSEFASLQLEQNVLKEEEILKWINLPIAPAPR